MTTDAILTNEKGYYDISVDENGDIATADFFDTAILYSIFGERRASSDEVVQPELRRGWIGNDDFENGSKIWLFSQARVTASNLRRLENEIQSCLQWLIDDGYAVSIDDVDVTLSNNVVRAAVTIRRSRDQVDRRFYDLWENTGRAA